MRYCATCGQPVIAHGKPPMIGAPRPHPIIQLRKVTHKDGARVSVYGPDRKHVQTALAADEALRRER